MVFWKFHTFDKGPIVSRACPKQIALPKVVFFKATHSHYPATAVSNTSYGQHIHHQPLYLIVLSTPPSQTDCLGFIFSHFNISHVFSCTVYKKSSFLKKPSFHRIARILLFSCYKFWLGSVLFFLLNTFFFGKKCFEIFDSSTYTRVSYWF